MKKIIVLLMLIISVKGSGQVLQKPAVYGYEFRRLAVDTLFAVPADTFSVPAALQSFPFIARKGTSFYFWNTSTHVWAAFSAAGATPTWQEVLDAGSTLNKNNTILGAGFDLAFSQNGSMLLNTASGLGSSDIDMSPQTVSIQALNTTRGSQLFVNTDSIIVKPGLGSLIIDTLNNETFQNTLMGWTTTSGANRGKVGYITLGSGLSLSSGVLSNSGVTSTPTWQQTLTAGSTLTTNNTILAGSTLLKIRLDEDQDFTGFEGLNYQSLIGFQNGNAYVRMGNPSGINGGLNAATGGATIFGQTAGSVSQITTFADSIKLYPHLGRLFIDTLTNLSTQNTLLGWKQGSGQGQVGYVTLGSGLSLSSGVLNTSGTVPTPISSLTAATGTNSINNGNNTQTWNWPTLTNGIGLLLTSLASTTGTTGGSVLTVLRSGSLANASQTTYGAIIQNQHTGTTETNVGLKVEATGATNNYALIVPSGSGNVGIGTATPATTFHVAGSLRFVTGNQGAGKVMVSDGSGNADWAATSTLSGLPYWPLSVGATLTGNVDMDMNSNTFSLTNASGNGTTFSITDGGGGSAYFDNTAHDIKVGIGTSTPASSALLDVSSTTKGVLIPRMTTTERNAISTPAVGLMIYNTTDSAFYYYRLSGWTAIGGGSSLFPTTGIGTATGNVSGDLDGNDFQISNGTNVGLSGGTFVLDGTTSFELTSQGGDIDIVGNGTDLNIFSVNGVRFSSNVGIGAAADGTGNLLINDLAGTGSRTVLASSTGVLSAPVSDRTTKENIKPLYSAIGKIMHLKPVSFDYRKEFESYGKGTQVGFIAQDIQQILPNSTYINNSNGKMGYNEIDLVPLLVKAMQEQQQQIDDLKNEIKKLKRK